MYFTFHRNPHHSTSASHEESYDEISNSKPQEIQHKSIMQCVLMNKVDSSKMLVPSSQSMVIKYQMMKVEERQNKQNKKDKEPHLLGLENKIFGEVIGLMEQIEEVKNKIEQDEKDIAQLNLSIGMMKCQGNESIFVENLQKQNEELQRCLRTLQMRFSGQLDQILNNERNKYQKILVNLNNIVEDEEEHKINHQIKQLIESNEQLRMQIRIIVSLQQFKSSLTNQPLRTERWNTLQQEEQKKYTFMADFQNFHQQYQDIISSCNLLQQQIANQQKRINKKVAINTQIKQERINTENSKVSVISSLRDERYSTSSKGSGLTKKSKNIAPYMDLVLQMKNILDR